VSPVGARVTERDAPAAAGFGTGAAHAPALDGVRAIAIGFVLWHHAVDHPWLRAHTRVTLGTIGVRLFFVLSGLLITRNLLVSRFEDRAPLGRGLKAFYLRRTLRIFPLYYAMLLVLALTSGAFREVWPWYVAYLQNIKMAATGHFLIASHFWTLAIEEQFYLAWPLVLFTLPRRAIGPVLAVVAALAVVWRATGQWALGLGELSIALFTPAAFDSLALGALGAWLLHEGRRPRNATLALVAAAGLAVVAVTFVAPSSFAIVFGDSGVSLAAFALVVAVAEDAPAPLAASLAVRPLVGIGRISYGVYVYHPFVMALVGAAAAPLTRLGGALVVVGELTATLAVAALSWRLYEKPINDLKNRLA
jgi:peptidoglycan/LPS O-acetylase OafA/YrhL